MAIKTFTAGSILTASDTNTYLANAGLVYVKSQTVTGGAGVSSVTVTDAFSATYDNYRIIWSGGGLSAETYVSMQLGNTADNYYGSFVYGSYNTTAIGGLNDNDTTQFTYVGGGSQAVSMVEIYEPFSAKWTNISARVRYDVRWGTYQGLLLDTNSYTSFKFLGLGGVTLSGGTITVYGYRKA